MTYLYGGSALGLVCISFIVFRIIVRNDYLRKGRLSFPASMLEFIVFALHANFMYLYIPVPWPELPAFPEPATANILAKLLLFAGLGITITAMTGLGFGPTMGQDKNAIRTTGLYKYSRNPQVIGYLLILLAFVLCYPSWYAAGWIALYAVIVGMMIRTEEEFLRHKYGETYAEYCRTVPRLIGKF